MEINPKDYEIYLKVKKELDEGKTAPVKIVEISGEGIENESFHTTYAASKRFAINYQTLDCSKKHKRPVLLSKDGGVKKFYKLNWL